MDYIEIRGLATLDDDPDCAFSRRQFMEGTGGMEPPEDMDPPGSERVIITIHTKQTSSPTLHGGRFDKPNDWLDPEKITATRRNSDGSVIRSRPLCQ